MKIQAEEKLSYPGEHKKYRDTQPNLKRISYAQVTGSHQKEVKSTSTQIQNC